MQCFTPTTGCYNRRLAKLGRVNYEEFSCRIAYYSRRYSRQPLDLAVIRLRVMRTMRTVLRTITHEWSINESRISVQEVEDFRDAHTWFPQEIYLSSGEHIMVMLLCDAPHLQESKDSRKAVIISLSTVPFTETSYKECEPRHLHDFNITS